MKIARVEGKGGGFIFSAACTSALSLIIAKGQFEVRIEQRNSDEFYLKREGEASGRIINKNEKLSGLIVFYPLDGIPMVYTWEINLTFVFQNCFEGI